MSHKPINQSARSIPWKPILFLVVLGVLITLAVVFDLGARIKELRETIRGLGAWGPLAYILLYILATVAMVPGTAMTALAGGLFGAVGGTVLASVGATGGAAAGFLVSRYFVRQSLAGWIRKKPAFHKLDLLAQRRGAWVVAITRLVPVFPFNLLNYALGLTGVGFWTYVFWSWLCMLPGIVLVVAGTDAIVKGLREGRVPWGMVGITAAAATILLGLAWFARKKMNHNGHQRR